MKLFIKSLSFSLIILSCNSSNDKTNNVPHEIIETKKSNEETKTDNNSFEKPIENLSNTKLLKYVLKGKITNATTNENGRGEFTLTEIEPDKYTCVINMDGKNLFGKIDLFGEKYLNPDNPNAVCIKFNGTLRLGDNDGSGFPPGTKATFSSIMNIFTDNATGEYTIGEIPNSSWKDKKQNGLFDLTIVSKKEYSPN